MAHLCRKFLLGIIIICFSLPSLAMEVYIPGEIKKTTACCYIIKTSEGRFIKMLKPRKKVRNPDPFKFKATMKYFSNSFKNAYSYWKGKVKLR